jgi:hypothetical protein
VFQAITFGWMKFSKSKSIELLLPAVIGFSAYAFFIRFHGFWPTDVNWLLPNWNGNIDSAGDYIGWEMYRQSSLLQWPIGRSPMLGPDGGSSIAFTTLPILALIFKPLTHWSREPLQFYGLWSMVCFLGQAVSAWKLVGLWVKDRLILALGICFFVMSPAFLDRLTFHFGPSAHWVLITALYLYFVSTFKLRNWLLLGSLSVLIFPYIAVMVAAIYFARIIRDAIQEKNFLKHLSNLVIYISVSAVVAWQCGYFMVNGGKIGAEGFGANSANALTLVDPGFPEMNRMPWSRIVPDRWQDVGQYEGFAFVGSGILILAIIAWLSKILKGSNCSRVLLTAPVVLMAAFFGRDPDPAQMKLTVLLGIVFALSFENLARSRQSNFVTKVILGCVTFGMFVFAMSNRMLLGQYQLASIKLTKGQLEILSTFRSTGRFVWPIMLLVIALVVVSSVRVLPRAIIVPILLVTLVFQIIDSNQGAKFTKDAFSRFGPKNYLTSQTWSYLGQKYDRVLFSPGLNEPTLLLSNNADFQAEDGVLWRDIGVLAQKYNWSVNSYYFNRDPGIRFQSDNNQLEQALDDGQFRERKLYVFIGGDQWERAKRIAGPNDLVGILNGVPILAPNFYPCDGCIVDGFIDRHALEDID